MAHITGGAFTENLPRVFPEGTAARIAGDSFTVPPLFTFLQQGGQVSDDEMLRAFNMGIGLIIACDARTAPEVIAILQSSGGAGSVVIGGVVEGHGTVEYAQHRWNPGTREPQPGTPDPGTPEPRNPGTLNPSTQSIGVLISGRGSNLQVIIDAIAAGRLDVRIAAVISNRADAAGLDRARAAGIETLVMPHKAFPDRAAYDCALADALKSRGVVLVCLAGFNAAARACVHRRVPERRAQRAPVTASGVPWGWTGSGRPSIMVSKSAAMVHFVTPDLDAGRSVRPPCPSSTATLTKRSRHASSLRDTSSTPMPSGGC